MNPMQVWIWLALAFSGMLHYQGQRPPTEAGSIAGHKVVRVYDMKTAEWPMRTPSYVLPDWAGKMWVAYVRGGIVLIDRATGRITDVLGGASSPQFAPTSKLYVGKDGVVWYLSHLSIRTVIRYRGQWVEAAVPDAASLGPAFSLFQDLDRNLWFTTRRGLVYHNGRRFSGPLKPPPEFESAYRALLFPGFDQDRQPQVIAEEGESRAVTEAGSGFQGADGLIWLGTIRAVLTFDQKTAKWELIRFPPGSSRWSPLCEGRGGAIWFADSAGQLALYQRREARWSMIDLVAHVPPAKPGEMRGVVVNAINQGSSGTMMFATSRGLVTFNPGLNKWESFTSANSALPDSDLTGITKDAEGRIWLIESSGIVVLDP